MWRRGSCLWVAGLNPSLTCSHFKGSLPLLLNRSNNAMAKKKNSSDSGTDEILLLLSFCASISVSLEDERSKTFVLA